MTINLDSQVAIVTGAGRGLGRCHALALAERGANIVVNDLGNAEGISVDAESVVAEIREAGGNAFADGANVTVVNEVSDMVEQTLSKWGRVDILINNAGSLRDKSFLKMTFEEFRQVIDVHLMGAVYCTRAVWEIMREQEYGRVVFTTSSSGLYGNFGQANYGAAKMALVGLMNTLHLEGMKYNIRTNCLAPAAGTAMTEGLFPETMFDLLSPESVSSAVIFLSAADAPSRKVIAAGGGCFSVYKGFETDGITLPADRLSAEDIASAWEAINDEAGMQEFQGGFEQASKFARKAADTPGLDLAP